MEGNKRRREGEEADSGTEEGEGGWEKSPKRLKLDYAQASNEPETSPTTGVMFVAPTLSASTASAMTSSAEERPVPSQVTDPILMAVSTTEGRLTPILATHIPATFTVSAGGGMAPLETGPAVILSGDGGVAPVPTATSLSGDGTTTVAPVPTPVQDVPSVMALSPTTAAVSATTPTGKEETVEVGDKMELLISAFSNSQQDQYEIFRRSTFSKSSIRKIMQSVCGSSNVPQNAVIAMAGITKVFVGEIVEEACQAREKVNEEGAPLQPKHIREAVRRLKNNDKLPNSKYKKVFPTR